MKKSILILTALIMTAIFSAFTTRQPDELFYRDESGFFQPKTEPGGCVLGAYYCEYEWNGSVPEEPQNEANYDPIGDPGLIYGGTTK